MAPHAEGARTSPCGPAVLGHEPIGAEQRRLIAAFAAADGGEGGGEGVGPLAASTH